MSAEATDVELISGGSTMLEKFLLKDKVAIITGAGTGLGKAMTMALGRAGANIVLAARRIGPLEEAANEVRALGRRALPISTDVTKSDQVDRMVERAAEEFGRVDVLINNAGGASGPGVSPLIEISDAQWQEGIDLELTGCFYCCRAVGRHMIRQGWGRIVNIVSLAGLRASGDVIYGIAKAGMMQLTRELAAQWASCGVNVNAICGGAFRSDRMLRWGGSEEALAKIGRLTPDGRIGEPAEIGPLAVFLASNASDYVTGQVFIIDGGVEADRYVPADYRPLKPLDQPGY